MAGVERDIQNPFLSMAQLGETFKMENTNIEEMAEKAKAFDRLKSIADRRNASGHYRAVTYTPELILSRLEKECDDLEKTMAGIAATKAAQQAKKDAELAACQLFKVGDTVTFEATRGRVETGEVVGFTTEGIYAPALEVWTGNLAQKVTGKPSCIKPLGNMAVAIQPPFKDGNKWCCVGSDFTNLQESLAGFGKSQDEAIADYRKAVLEASA